MKSTTDRLHGRGPVSGKHATRPRISRIQHGCGRAQLSLHGRPVVTAVASSAAAVIPVDCHRAALGSVSPSASTLCHQPRGTEIAWCTQRCSAPGREAVRSASSTDTHRLKCQQHGQKATECWQHRQSSAGVLAAPASQRVSWHPGCLGHGCQHARPAGAGCWHRASFTLQCQHSLTFSPEC